MHVALHGIPGVAYGCVVVVVVGEGLLSNA